MGWSTGWLSRKSLLDELKSEKGYPQGWKVIETAMLGFNTLWTVVETSEGKRWIRLDLIKRFGAYDWGHKDMSEDMHPYYYNCPLRFLDMVPVECEKWRIEVRSYHARRKLVLHVGQEVQLLEGFIPNRLTITSLRPLRGVVADGKLYRISKNVINELSKL